MGEETINTEKPIESFPVSDHLEVLDGFTVNKVGLWWTAVLVTKFPKAEKPRITIYRWKKVDGVWRPNTKFSFNNLKSWENVKGKIEALKNFLE